ncbi:hypothetical protein P5673_018728 [Acropora cervicornis]|uniref:Uncharacterized protein n=1 Tax=Acropora cervicornis TaxID=6130 RepID=A0AAD9V2R1_ACRCE|nr:hypothetical protein P5673_018728 [Acropora cervicornis]
MKFSVEREWIKAVRGATGKPDYGMLNMDNQLEEVIGNKLELVGLVIDSYLFELGKTLTSKLSRSKATGLVNPVFLFFPWAIFRHLLTLCRGYSSEVNTTRDGRKRVPSKTGQKNKSVYSGKSMIVVSKSTPFCIEYLMKNQRACVSFYIQRHTEDNYAIDSSLQSLMNSN